MQQTTSDLATILRPLSSQENMCVLLEVLTVIPEEVSLIKYSQNKMKNNPNQSIGSSGNKIYK